MGKRSSICTAMYSRGMTGKWKHGVALVAVAKVGDCVFGPLVCLGQEHSLAEVRVDVCAQRFEKLVRLRQVLAVGALAFVKIRHSIEPQAVDAHLQPEINRSGSAPAAPADCRNSRSGWWE